MSDACWVAAALYAGMSLVAFLAFGLDKYRARRGQRRIPEARLHLLELLGGWPGALAGQAAFAHKRRKGRYQAVLAGIVVLHGLAWWLAWRLAGG